MKATLKGDLEWISVIFAFSLSVLLVVVIAPYLSQVSFTANLYSTQEQSIKKYRAHATLASIKSNSKLMEDLNTYTTQGISDDNLESEIENLFTPVGKSSVPDDILSGTGTSPSFETPTEYYSYRFRLMERMDGSYKTRYQVQSPDSELKRYSQIIIASPSENRHKISLGIGDSN